MDTAGLSVLPRTEGTFESDLREVDIAIELIARGAAVRVRLVGLTMAARIAPIALAHAQRAGVQFRVEPAGGTTRLVFGPAD
jgi:hypothetical protein